jgi:hypothetical protein
MSSRSATKLLVVLGAASALAFAATLPLARASGPAAAGPVTPHAFPSDDGPPRDAAYQRVMARGGTKDYGLARRELVTLAQAHPGTNLGAWSLYQAAFAAEADGDAAGATALRAELRQQYPTHQLALRVAPSPTVSAPQRAPQDCGSRSLLYLCRQARHAATLPELTRQCATTPSGTTLEGLAKGAQAVGLRTAALQVDASFLKHERPAGIAWVDGDHYVAFTRGPGSDSVELYDPNDGVRRAVPAEALVQRSQGIVLLLGWEGHPLPAVP